MRIAVVGAHGVGKTEWVTKLTEGTRLPVITEQARVVAKEMGITHCNQLLTNPELARKFQWRVLNRQIQMQLKYPDGFISDWSTLDCIAYWKLYVNEKISAQSGETKYYINKARIHAWKRLDLILHIPPSGPIIDDGFRLSGHAKKVDKHIRNELDLIKNWGIPVLTINNRPNQAEIANVVKAIEEIQRGYKNAR